MKKILIPFFFLIIPLFAYGQLSGDGSSGNPFYGTISANVQWSAGDFIGSTVYIGTSGNPDLTVTTGGHLTIDPGLTVILTQLTTDLIITGSGQLTADGSGSNRILFTKDPAVSHWGHITFETPGTTTPITGSGSFKYCTVEYGYTTGNFPNPAAAGGAIQINAQGVVIENCYFNDNYARFGGAVAVNEGRNTIIRNSFFKSNDAIECAGALLLHLSSTAKVENCIFEGNYCAGSTQTFYGGGAIWSRQNTSSVVNCTFVNNTSPRAGDALYTYSSPGTKIINSIFWGSNDQYANNSSGYTIVNCAFESVKPASAVNSIILNSVNTAADGPNFVATDGSDWSIKLISPCRDAGINSYTGVTIPTSDYIGNPTISNKDMGAYELQYSRWTGTTSDSWSTASNWVQSVDPSSGSGDVIIPSGLSTYPVNSSNPAFTIGAGKKMIMEPGSKVTLSSITNNGSLRLISDATGMSSLIVNSYSGNDADVVLYLTGGGTIATYKWHYISSPVTSLPVSTFTGVTLDVVGFAEPRVTTDLVQGWVAWDGYVYATGGDDDTYAFSNLTPGKGYDYWNQLDNSFTLSGSLNISNTPVSLSYSGTANSGFNLLGNPFTSGLNWDDIINDVYFPYPLSTSKGLYFTRDNVQCSYVGGVGIPADVTGIIPPMQGFFVKTSAGSNTITLPLAARTHNSIHSRYKGSGTIPLVRLQLSKDDLSDETVIRFDEMAKTGFDNDFDALKVFSSPDNIGIYSSLEGTEFAINGIPFPEQIMEIPLVVNVINDGVQTITATQFQGLGSYVVDLVDNTAGSTIRLNNSQVMSFTASKGLITDRFILKVSNLTTGDDSPVFSKKSFNIFQGFGNINIQLLGDDWDGKYGSVRVIDLSGKILADLHNQEFRKGSIIEMRQPSGNGLYLVEIRSGIKRYIEKIAIK